MCGIAGYNWQDPVIIKKMTDSIIHRGPDGEGFYTDPSVSLGHRRLSIIDLSDKGKQPMTYGNYIIVFNGEIYNYKEVKDELAKKNHRFISESDTEVILHAYEEWGEQCVNKLNGMWAFCIYDKNKNTLFLSRDRFGEKPLYYYWDEKQFIFASEIKAIREHALDLKINKHALNYFFYQKYIGGEYTIYDKVHKLKPAHNLVFDLKEKKITLQKYYDLEKEIAILDEMPLDRKTEAINNLIVDSVEKRLIADVPVGSFLSGGVDSSLVSAIIAKKKKDFDTFSIGFKEKSFDEIEFSKIAAKHIGTKHHFSYLAVDEEIIKYVIGNMDEPFGDSSVIPTYLLSKITREKVTVSLSGDAADEIFGGYDTYLAYKIASFIPGVVLKVLKRFADQLPSSDEKVSLVFKVKRFLSAFDLNVSKRHLNWMATFKEEERNNLLGNNFISNDSLSINAAVDQTLGAVQLNDIHNYLAEDILKKVDYASMLNSLEVRVPFLDHRLVSLALSLPENYKIRWLRTKWLLKKIAANFLPGKIINRKKRGFTVPVSKWIKESPLIRKYITEEGVMGHELLNREYILNLYHQHINNKADHARQLWLVFVFNYWWNNKKKYGKYPI